MPKRLYVRLSTSATCSAGASDVDSDATVLSRIGHGLPLRKGRDPRTFITIIIIIMAAYYFDGEFSEFSSLSTASSTTSQFWSTSASPTCRLSGQT